jgi:hypothetical protein
MAGAKAEKTLPGEQRTAGLGNIGPEMKKSPVAERPPGVSSFAR